ncbi:MBL fold metallo-hydrolase [Filibacter tadaridae]|uniref:Putative polyketide biosynthesis zinc-dependent hydrolase BaeB n=1 Tax=Filibacter tadaridae TaxID=2483811 RepID=A0A3P5WHD0_9BACL|nr:MBL fold metallo-hydrolase [Filibacter tadaridae]VDC21068.1 putative polyketide biosynthesis zinc-dependent hydrolase BaeB [Filibacter tadaridae]
MYFQSFTDKNLAQNAYLIGCQRTGESIIIDPPRSFTHIIEAAKKEGLRVTAAADTHIHADYVSGARQLAVEHGVKLYLSDEGDENWKYRYTDGIDVQLVKEGSTFSIGNIDFDVWHTPGHTPESISFILTDRGGGATEPMGIFTGDFVFVGDVGRPDLLEKAAGISGTAVRGAREMFQSINRFKQLPDHLIVWPGHGAGSACGKALGSVPTSTVGYEKKFNWALQIDDKNLFVEKLLKGQPEAPTYFAEMKKVNKGGPAILENRVIEVIGDAGKLKDVLSEESNLVIDARPAATAEKGLLPNAINIPFNKSFANWAGWLAKYDEDLIVVADIDDRVEIENTLHSIGLDRIRAFADPAILAETALNTYGTINVDEFNEQMKDENAFIIDVRNDTEWNDGHLPDAHHSFLGKLRSAAIPDDKELLLHCQGGARSAIAASVLKSRGFENVKHMAGGYAAYKKAGYETE